MIVYSSTARFSPRQVVRASVGVRSHHMHFLTGGSLGRGVRGGQVVGALTCKGRMGTAEALKVV